MPNFNSTNILGDLRVTGISNLNSVGPFTLTGQLTSTIATGTAPFIIASTTRVANLNVATAGLADASTQIATTQQITSGDYSIPFVSGHGAGNKSLFTDNEASLVYNPSTNLLTLLGDIAVNGGDIITSAAIFNIGNTTTGAQTLNLATAGTTTSASKILNLATGGSTGSTTNVNIGSANGGTTTINSPNTSMAGATITGTLLIGADLTSNSATLNIGNTTTGDQTLNLGTAVTAANNTKTVNLGTAGGGSSITYINIGGSSLNQGTTTINSANSVISGNLTVDGSNTIINGTLKTTNRLTIDYSSTGGDGTWDKSGILIKNNNNADAETAIAMQNKTTGSNFWIHGLNQSADYKFAYGGAFADSLVKFTIYNDGLLRTQADSSTLGKDSRSGTNIAGGNFTFASGQGTGNATGSTLIFQTSTPTTSGSTIQALATRLTIGQTDTTVANNLIVSGNLTINGTTTTINSTTKILNDPIMSLGGTSTLTSNDGKDRGIEFRHFNGTEKYGFFGYDNSSARFIFIPEGANSGEVFSGNTGIARFSKLELGNLSGNVGIFETQAASSDKTYTFPNVTGTVALTSDLHTRSHTMTSTSDHTAGNWKVFHSNGSGQVVDLSLGNANTYLKSAGTAAAPTFSQIAYSDISGVLTEISTGEVDSTSDSNLRAITGRRLQYALRNTETGSTTLNLAAGATTSGTKIVNLGTGAGVSTTTNITLGSANGGTTIINSPSTTLNGNLTLSSGIASITSSSVASSILSISAAATTNSVLDITANSLTTGNGINVSSTSANITSGKLINVTANNYDGSSETGMVHISSTSTGRVTNSSLLYLDSSGANNSMITKGAYISAANPGTTATAIALQLNATAGTTAKAIDVLAGTSALQALTATTGTFSSALSATTLTSTIATGTAPLTVTSTTLVTNLNADMVGGYHVATGATANTVVVRNANNYIYANFINSNRGNETSVAASYIYDSGDGWLRKKTLANTTTEIVTQAAVESAVSGIYVTMAGNETVSGVKTFSNSSTTGNALSVTANSLTTGNALSIQSSSTARTTGSLLDISSTGNMGTAEVIVHGGRISVTNSGSNAGNTALRLTASGATQANVGLYITAGDFISDNGRLISTVGGTATSNFIANSIGSTTTSSTTSVTKTGLAIQSTGTWNGSSSVNRGLYVNATGGTTNYSAIFEGGSVGIGTTTPGTINSTAFAGVGLHNVAGTQGRLVTQGSGSAQLLLNDSGATANTRIKHIISDDGILHFGKTTDAGSVTNHLSILDDGKVGIGTSTPGQTLDVNGTSRFRNTFYIGGTDNVGMISWSDTSPSRLIIRGQTGYGLALGTNGVSDRLFISSTNGDVGIGNTAPTEKLEVSGNVKGTRFKTANWTMEQDGTTGALMFNFS